MDGTTKATEFAQLLQCIEMNWMFTNDLALMANDDDDDDCVPIKKVPDTEAERKTIFHEVQKQVLRMNFRGYFNKRWLLFPINMGNQHWTFAGVLNGACLGSQQDKRFSGYLYYDSYRPQMTRLEELTILHNKGILNILVYANLCCGQPKLTGVDIRDVIFDPNSFARIAIPHVDRVIQRDGWNCGLFLCMSMMEMSIVHSQKYFQKNHFDEGMDGMDRTFFLKEGDWFKLFKEPRTQSAASKTGPVYPGLPKQIFQSFREQATCLFNRILTLKSSGKEHLPHFPETGVPKYVKKNLKNYVWEYGKDDQKQVQKLNAGVRGGTEALAALLRCDNPIIKSRQQMCNDEDENNEDDLLSTRHAYTVKELEEAGMKREFIKIHDDNSKPPEEETSDEEPAPKSTKKIKQVLASLNSTGEEQEGHGTGDNNDDLKPAAKAMDMPAKTENVGDVAQQGGEVKREGLRKREGVEATPKPPASKKGKKNNAADHTAGFRKTPRLPKRRKKKSDDGHNSDDDFVIHLPRESHQFTEEQIQQRYGKRKSRDYHITQRNIDSAKNFISKCIQLPNTAKDLSAHVKWYRDDGGRGAGKTIQEQQVYINKMHREWTTFEPHKNNEGYLRLWDSVKALSYTFENSEKLTKGIFYVKLRKDDQVLAVARDWVVRNFEKQVVDAVVNHSLGAFVPVESNVKLMVDRRQIQKLRYVVPTTTSSNSEQTDQQANEEKTDQANAAFFQGVLSDRTTVPIAIDYV